MDNQAGPSLAASIGQWSAAFTLLMLLLAGLSATARADDRFVYAVFPPWLRSAETLQRVIAAGARPLRAPILPFVVEVALANAAGGARLSAAGAWLFAANPQPLCSVRLVRRT